MLKVQTTQVQRNLERAASIKMMVFEALSCILFLFLPNPEAFARLEANGFGIAPTLLAFLNGIGAMIYFWLADSAEAHSMSTSVRRLVFFIASIPLMIYLIPLGLIALTLTGSVAGLSFIAIYIVILLMITAVFQGYSRRLEVVTLSGMALFMGLIAYSFTKTTPIQFTETHFPVNVIVILALIGGLGYVLMLTPRVRLLPVWVRRAWFIASEAVLPIYATVTLLYTLFFGANSIFASAAVYDLYLLIALLAYALFREPYAPSLD